jgi:hypothetical protein
VTITTTNIKITNYWNPQELRHQKASMHHFLTIITKITVTLILIAINFFNKIYNPYNPLHQSLRFQIHKNKTISQNKTKTKKKNKNKIRKKITSIKLFLIIFKKIVK